MRDTESLPIPQAENRTQGLALPGQALYHWAKSLTPKRLFLKLQCSLASLSLFWRLIRLALNFVAQGGVFASQVTISTDPAFLFNTKCIDCRPGMVVYAFNLGTGSRGSSEFEDSHGCYTERPCRKNRAVYFFPNHPKQEIPTHTQTQPKTLRWWLGGEVTF